MQTATEGAYASLLDSVNEAALDSGHWLDVVQRLAAMTGCVAGGLTLESPDFRDGRPLQYFGFDEDHVARTWSHYLPKNPLLRVADQLRPGVIVTNEEVVEPEAFKRSEFYDGWARPQGLCSPITLILHRSQSRIVPLTLVRPDITLGASDPACAFLRRVAPHLARAFSVTMRLQRVDRDLAGLQGVIKSLSVAVMLVDSHDTVLALNGAADTLVGAGGPMILRRGKLHARGRRSEALLQSALSALRGGEGPGTRQIILQGEGEQTLMVSIVPIVTGEFVAEDAFALLIDDIRPPPASSARTLAKAFRLTPAEARLVDRLLSGGNLREAAEALGISHNTAKTHLKAVFAKTGVNSQGALTRLAMAATPTAR